MYSTQRIACLSLLFVISISDSLVLRLPGHPTRDRQSSTLFRATNRNQRWTNLSRHHDTSKSILKNKHLLQAHPSNLAGIITGQSMSTTQNNIIVLSSIATLMGYHLNLMRKELTMNQNDQSTKHRPKTWRQYQADTREDWSKHVRETEGWLYAIQSLRNAITAQTFLATTVLSLLTLITGRMWDIIRASNNMDERRMLTIQLFTIATTMLGSAYQFLQGVRLMTHVGFMFPTKNNSSKVDNIMRQTENCQWMGLRWMYISLAPIAWAVGGSRAFFVSAMVLLQFFRSIDKCPEGLIN